jgi:hypothetical protein
VHQTRGGNGKTERGSRGAHLGQQTTQKMVIAAHGGGVASLDSSDGDGSTWGSSGYKKTTGSFTNTSSSSSRLQLWRAAAEDGT